MKLYTEKQVDRMMELARFSQNSKDRILFSFTPIEIPNEEIEIPTDEEIRKESHNYFIRGQLGFEAAADTERAFLKGVLWMRDKIKGGNQ